MRRIGALVFADVDCWMAGRHGFLVGLVVGHLLCGCVSLHSLSAFWLVGLSIVGSVISFFARLRGGEFVVWLAGLLSVATR